MVNKRVKIEPLPLAEDVEIKSIHIRKPTKCPHCKKQAIISKNIVKSEGDVLKLFYCRNCYREYHKS